MKQTQYQRLYDPTELEVNNALDEGWQIFNIATIHDSSSFEPTTIFHLVKLS